MDFFTVLVYLLLLIVTVEAIRSLIAIGGGGAGGNCRKVLPPGPTPVPIIGCLLKLGRKPHHSLAELAKVHGPIMTLKLGHITTVVISSADVAREALQKQDLAFSSRSPPNALHAHDHHRYSIVWLPVANRWRSLRKALNSNIFAGSRLDDNQHLRRRKVEELIAYVRKSSQSGEAVDIGQAAFQTALNLLSNTIFSVDLAKPNEDSAKYFRDLIWNIMVEAGKTNLVDYFPELAKIDPQSIKRRMTIHLRKLFQLFGRLIDERVELRRLRRTSGNNDVIDILLNICEENSDHEIDRNHIEHLCLDLFGAGTDTTSSTLEWAMAEMLHKPETLKKAKAELEQAIGKGKLVEESDIVRLPYLRSIVKETLRIHPPVPFLIPRKVETDVQICGYDVPKGTQVLVNVWAIGRDPKTWSNPTSFMPERFLDSEIDFRGRDFELIPFGAGRRICPGLPLAIRTVPTMLGSLINLFDWKLGGGIAPKDLDMEERFGITLQKEKSLYAVPLNLY